MIDILNNKNASQNITIKSIHDEAFRSYGRILEGYDFDDLISYMEKNTDIPESGNVYVASVEEMESLSSFSQLLSSVVYGGMPVEIGYCNGRNSTMNGFEYHKGSEINIAVTDFLLILGHNYDISKELTYDPSNAEVFYVEKGAAIEMFENTLHLSPCRVSDAGFKAVVVLPRGTNTPLTHEEKIMRDKLKESGDKEAVLLLQRNKWVISHPDREPLIKQGAHPGVLGENFRLYY